MTTTTCPKCGKTMVEGFVLHQTDGRRTVPQWYSGKPVKSMWLGLKLSALENHAVQTYRCTGCGYLESYAGRR